MDHKTTPADGLDRLRAIREALLASMKEGIPATKLVTSPATPDALRASHTVYSRTSY